MATLMDLASSDPSGAAEHLAKIYEWKHDRAYSVGKALVAAGFAVFLAPLVSVIAPQSSSSLSWLGILVTWAAALVVVVAGSVVFFRARELEIEYLTAQSVLAEIVDIHAFLRLYKGRA